MHDVPAQLAVMGVEVTGGLQRAEEANDVEVLKNFEILPKIYSGRQVTIQFSLAHVRATLPEDCVALHLEHGASIASQVVIETGQTFYVYGEREMALSLLGLAKGSTVKARANTVFGVCKQVVWTEDEPLPDIRAETGLVITEILNVEPPTT